MVAVFEADVNDVTLLSRDAICCVSTCNFLLFIRPFSGQLTNHNLMKNITITLDLKSICIGALGVFAIMSLSNFNNADDRRNDAADEVRRYQAVTSEKGDLLILDTKTGKYLIDLRNRLKPRWMKGEFTTDHANGEVSKAD